ncbi:MAG: IS3 family transposase, partial [Candidatus Riflebacteria bacterium]
TADYKLKILSEIDASKAEGEIGAILRREGLYHSNIKTWRQQREKGELIPKKRGRKPLEINPLSRQNAQLEKENKRLKERLARAETIIEFQKKIAEILGKSTGLNS